MLSTPQYLQQLVGHRQPLVDRSTGDNGGETTFYTGTHIEGQFRSACAVGIQTAGRKNGPSTRGHPGHLYVNLQPRTREFCLGPSAGVGKTFPRRLALRHCVTAILTPRAVFTKPHDVTTNLRRLNLPQRSLSLKMPAGKASHGDRYSTDPAVCVASPTCPLRPSQSGCPPCLWGPGCTLAAAHREEPPCVPG